MFPFGRPIGRAAGHAADGDDDRWISEFPDVRELDLFALSPDGPIHDHHFDELGQMGPDPAHDPDPFHEPETRHGPVGI